MIHVIIIDDESHARSLLDSFLAKSLGVEYQLVASCASVAKGVQAIREHKVDLVFLDIQMPEEDGFALLSYFKEVDFEIIFVTAFDQYALKAIKSSALHYLLKPIDPDELNDALDRFKKTAVSKAAMRKKLDHFSANLKAGKEVSRAIFNTTTGFEVVLFKDIMYVTAHGNYSMLYFMDGAHKLVTCALKTIEEILPETVFFRVHDSHIINMNAIKSYTKAYREITLVNGKTLKVADRKLKSFLSRLSETV